MAIEHTSTLIERHRVLMPGAHSDIERCRQRILDYAEMRGFELSNVRVITGGPNASGTPLFAGVTFDVVVGSGVVATDQRIPGVLDTWTWSAPALEWWHKILDRAVRPRGHLASVSSMLRDGWRGPDALNGFNLEGLPPWDKRPRNCPTDASGQVLPHTHADGHGCE